jgi:ketosteroid isomerase-like protein
VKFDLNAEIAEDFELIVDENNQTRMGSGDSHRQARVVADPSRKGCNMGKRILTLFVLMMCCGLSTRAQLAPVQGESRQGDRDAVLKSLDRIFQGFIHQDSETLRATHGIEWLGFLEGSLTVMHGNSEYMQSVSGAMTSPVHMTGYKLLEVDVVFYGDVAIVPFVCEIEVAGPGVTQPSRNKLRILDVFAKLNGEWVQVATDTAQSPDAQATALASPRQLQDPVKRNLLDAREAVWRAYFANDRLKLEELLPSDLIAINGGTEKWSHRDEVFAGAKSFAESGGKLVRLEFKDTEIQVYGYTAIVYSQYLYEIENGGRQSTQSGRATETFVFRQSKWLNTGWHLDSGK